MLRSVIICIYIGITALHNGGIKAVGQKESEKVKRMGKNETGYCEMGSRETENRETEKNRTGKSITKECKTGKSVKRSGRNGNHNTVKRAAAILCICGISAGMISGCGKNGGEKDDGKNSAPVVTIFNRVNPEVSVDNNPLLNLLGENVGVTIEYNAPPINNYDEKLQIIMASKTLPDIIYNWHNADTNYELWAKDGLLAELDDKIVNYPNLMAAIPKESWEAVRSATTGKIHGIPKPNIDGYWGIVINQQWLDNLGLKAPETLEEFRQVCHAFTYDDPDGNGKNDTYGLSVMKPGGTGFNVTTFQSTFGLSDVRDTDGTYKLYQKRSGYLPYLTYLRELYLDGVLDPEFITNERGTDQEKLFAGKTGMVLDHQAAVMTYIAKDPDAVNKYTYIAPVNQPGGGSVIYVSPSIWGMWMISADADVDRCLSLIDYAFSDEGFQLLGVGTEDYYNSYDFEGRRVDRTEEQSAALAKVTSSYLTFSYAKDGLSPIIENATTQERIDKYYQDYNTMMERSEEVRVPFVRASLVATFAADHPDLVTKLVEMEVKFVVGEIEEADLTKFLEHEYYPAAEEMEQQYIQWMEEYESGK